MIYLDHAATTPLSEGAFGAMKPYMTNIFGNPSSLHAYGREAANAVIAARDGIAAVLGVPSEDIYFTSGGSEACTAALKGVCAANCDRGKHIVVSAIEHHALIESALDMQKYGWEVTFVKPDRRGIISPREIASALRGDTVFAAVMGANNEVGVIQPIADIYAECQKRGVFFFCDCVQTAGVLPFSRFPADGLAFSAHKFYGPKGFGGLYMRRGTRFSRLIDGGMQERGKRGGTTYVAGAVGCAYALKEAYMTCGETNSRVAALRDMFIKRVESGIAGAHLNGDREMRLPSNVNFSFDGCRGDEIAFCLDLEGVAVSTGSACSSGATSPSHVLLAMGLSEEEAKSSVRFTFGRDNTEEEAEEAYKKLSLVVDRIRRKNI